MRRWHRHLDAVIAATALTLIGVADAAQEQALPLAGGAGPIALPSIGRVLFAFVIAAVLAIAAGVALRRLAPKFTGSILPTGNLRVLERLNLGADLRVHLVQTGHGKVLITTHRNGLSVVTLDGKEQGGAL